MALSREQWDRLHDKAKWDIQVALRGPDSCYGETLKWFTTAVIRGQMKDAFRVGGQVNNDLQLVIVPSGDSATIPKAYEKAGRLAWNYEHFIDHVKAAASWIGLPVLYVEPKVWHDAMQKQNATRAAEVILDAAREWHEYSKTQEDPALVALRDRTYYKAGLIKELERHYSAGRIYR